MTLSTDAPSDGVWPTGTAMLCETWVTYSPSSSLSSQSCSPGPSGGRLQQFAHGSHAGKSAAELPGIIQLSQDTCLRNKRARLQLGPTSSCVQVYCRGEGPQASSGQPEYSLTPSPPHSVIGTFAQPAGGWAPVAPQLSTSYVGGRSSSSGDQIAPHGISSRHPEALVAAFLCLPPSDGSLASSSAAMVEQATSTASRTSWQLSESQMNASIPQPCSILHPCIFVKECTCRAAGVRCVVNRPQCEGASHSSHQTCQPLSLAASDISTRAPLQCWAAVAAGMCVPAVGGPSLSFVFPGGDAPGPLAATAQRSLQSMASSLPAGWIPPSGFPGADPSCRPSVLAPQWGPEEARVDYLVGRLLNQQLVPQQLRPQILAVQQALAPQLLTPHFEYLAAAGRGDTALHVPPHQQLPVVVTQPVQQKSKQRQQLGGGCHRRVRPPSPVPPSAPLTPPLPGTLVPEDWILHVVKVLGMSEPDTARLALHCWRRVAGLPQLHHATRLWPCAAAGRNLYSTACLWVSIKLEEKRRAAPGGVVLAHMAGTTPAALCSGELAVMNWLEWRPYEGYRLDESHLLVYM